MKTNVLITGSNGQLGKSLSALIEANINESINFTLTTRGSLDITNKVQVDAYFQSHTFQYCINCAAYTAVDKAEEAQEQAYLINATGVKNLAEACEKSGVILIHISTDFVFDGEKTEPYKETDRPNPINVYGVSKLQGEMYIQALLNEYFIIRTSWLYSEYGNNFVKTMLRLGAEKSELQVVNDQIGSPTYTKDLAEVILKIIISKHKQFGVYHYSNEGVASWYDFANTIFEFTQIKIDLIPIPTEAYQTPAIRPRFSVLDTTKIEAVLGISISNWKDSLSVALTNFVI